MRLYLFIFILLNTAIKVAHSQITFIADLDTANKMINSTHELTRFGDDIVFVRENLYKYDGDSVIVIHDFVPGDLDRIHSLITFDSNLYFNLGGDGGNVCYKYDGDTVHIVNGGVPIFPGDGIVYNGKIIVFHFISGLGNELYSFDGDSLTLIEDIFPGGTSSNPSYFLEFNGYLYFFAKDPTNSRNIFKYNGDSIQKVMSLDGVANIEQWIVYDSAIYMSASLYSDSAGIELYKYNGEDSISLIADIRPNHLYENGSVPKDFYVHDNKLFFSANHHVYERELFMYNGDTTLMLADLYPGFNSSFPRDLITYDNDLYFSAVQSYSLGDELYRYNGNSIQLVQNLNTAYNKGAGCVEKILYDSSFLFVAEINDSIGPALFKYSINYTPTFTVVDSILDTVCGLSYSIGVNMVYSSGIYRDTAINILPGINEITIYNIIIDTPVITYIVDTGCAPYIGPSGKLFNESGTYQDTVNNQSSFCDSIYDLTLIVYNDAQPFFYFRQNFASIIELVDSSNNLHCSYKWFWGDGSIDSGIAMPSHTYLNGGSYEVCLELFDTVNNCPKMFCDSLFVDSNGIMRSVFTVNVVSPTSHTTSIISLEEKNSIDLFPNPTTNYVIFSSNEIIDFYSIIDIHGKEIKSAIKTSKKSSEIDFSSIGPGIYLIKFVSKNNKTYYKKIIVSR